MRFLLFFLFCAAAGAMRYVLWRVELLDGLPNTPLTLVSRGALWVSWLGLLGAAVSVYVALVGYWGVGS